ncbi:hypothetical protein Ddye_018306 [Dipteronia dyeriana]|uniref:Uncharacterized protein n=1 Tax=Dipteronia dyeriana TaxID=168575 RepID=A0AAD9UB10_9ROSI|nr:hypothetical protein Ddye_018306 [Dipteronia dyeriana]
MFPHSVYKHWLAPPGCCSYEVPSYFSFRRDLLTPIVFSIGPIHHGKKELALMEDRKKIYYEKFCSRIPKEYLEKFKSILQYQEICIHATYCYKNGICPLQLDELRSIVLFDSIFIIELFLSYHEKENDGFLNETMEKNVIIKRDLLLLENQVPYHILNQLYRLLLGITRYQEYPSLLVLSCKFFDLRIPVQELCPRRVEHFTDLARSSLMGVFSSDPLDLLKSSGEFLSLPTAMELKKLGVVRFEPIEGGYIADMKCTSRWFIVKLIKLQIPHIEVNLLSECMFQNVSAFELCAYNPEYSHVSNFLYLMSCLVTDEEDLNLLVTNKKMFQSVTEGRIGLPDRDIFGVCETLRSLVNY